MQLKGTPFKNVQPQIGYCGIWCGSCVVGNGTLQEVAKKFKKTLGGYGVLKWCPGTFDRAEFLLGLDTIAKIHLCPGCLRGGGRENCELRKCATDRNLADCRECAAPSCDYSTLLQHMRSGARAAGLSVYHGGQSVSDFIESATDRLRGQWPGQILLPILDVRRNRKTTRTAKNRRASGSHNLRRSRPAT